LNTAENVDEAVVILAGIPGFNLAAVEHRGERSLSRSYSAHSARLQFGRG